VKIVVDHLVGSRRGQRQEFPAGRVTIGRHPKNDIVFDAHRDLDASSRHAELREKDGAFVLCDVGSSNGTFVGGSRVSEVVVEAGTSVVVEFGAGGPQLRIWVGDDDAAPDPIRAGMRFPWGWLLVALLVGVLVAMILLRLAK
jgi:pSer/pThr/pTyr-binding forkhead associated (FHA) protein